MTRPDRMINYAETNAAWSHIVDATQQSNRTFIKNCSTLRQCQNDLLLEIIRSNINTSAGRQYNFKEILNAADPLRQYQQNVPRTTYDDLTSLMQSQMAGSNALLADEILFYERTGGSSGGVKYIPFTRDSLNLLHCAVNPWLHDLITSRPGITQGCAYWSISQTLHTPGQSSDGTRLGGISDLEFLPENIQQAFAATMTDPTLILTAADYSDWQRRTLLTLVLHKNLTLISIWSPSFLTTLLQAFDSHKSWIFAALENPADHDLDQAELLEDENRNLEAIKRLRAATTTAGIDCRILWPNLDTISCWTHGPASGPVAELRQWFPQTHIQPKGLLATEGAVSIPLNAASYPVLAFGSGFFEFLDAKGQTVLPEDLHTGSQYRVLITNASGLYRYDIGDQIRMQGWFNGTPMIEFTGRSSNTSDLCGEKLEEAFINQCINDCRTDQRTIAMLVPQDNHYCLLSDGSEELTVELDHKLCSNPQYKYARDLGQLGPLRFKQVKSLSIHHLEWRKTRGQTPGDIKPVALCTDPDFIDYLDSITA